MIRRLAKIISFGVPNPDRWSWRWLVAPVPMLLAVLMSFNSAQIDLFFRPIVVDFEVDTEKSYRTENVLHLFGNMELARKNGPNRCEFGAVSIRDQAGDKLPYWFEANRGRGESDDRPDGYQPWGPWVIVLAVDPATDYARMYVTHECRQVWFIDTPTADWVLTPISLNTSIWLPKNIRMERRISSWIAKSTLQSRLDVGEIAFKADAERGESL